MIHVVHGDVLNSGSKFICHQVNCQGKMGSGVAKQIREKYPVVYTKYKRVCDRYSEKERLMGRILNVPINEDKVIVNIFGQLDYGYDGKRHTDISALRRACEELSDIVQFGETIAMPYRIGCGLGGGDWGEVMDMLSEVFRDHLLTLYKMPTGGAANVGKA